LDALGIKFEQLRGQLTDFDFKTDIKTVLMLEEVIDLDHLNTTLLYSNKILLIFFSKKNENISPFINLYQKQVWIDRFRTFLRIEEELEGLLDKFIEQAEINPNPSKCTETDTISIKGMLLFNLLYYNKSYGTG
jgi:hypothetical protein